MPHRLLTRDITAQPDKTACGPTCLDVVHGFYGDAMSPESFVEEVERLDEDGTLDVFLACHALERLIGALLLGIVTYDANLLIIEPKT